MPKRQLIRIPCSGYTVEGTPCKRYLRQPKVPYQKLYFCNDHKDQRKRVFRLRCLNYNRFKRFNIETSCLGVITIHGKKRFLEAAATGVYCHTCDPETLAQELDAEMDFFQIGTDTTMADQLEAYPIPELSSLPAGMTRRDIFRAQVLEKLGA